MIEKSVTDGESLCKFINNRMLASAPWDALRAALQPTGRPSELVEFYRQITAVGMTGRIVSAGRSLAETVDVYEPAFRSELTTLLREYVGIPYRLLDDVVRFASRAVAAALEPLRNSVQNQVRAWAMRSHPDCYMCGVSLNFEGTDLPTAYTCEHVWPRAYGGNSIVENLLPACSSCNSKKKANFATWTMPAVQSLVLGLAPAPNRLQEIHGSYKYALHYRAAQRLAIDARLTLKEAFLRLGPWQDVRIRDEGDVVDIFNLENHVVDGSVT